MTMRTIIKKKNIDLVISYYFFPHNIIANILGFFTNRPVIASFIGSDIHMLMANKLFNKFFLPIVGMNSLMFVTGKHSLQTMIHKELPKNKLRILPNPNQKQGTEVL